MFCQIFVKSQVKRWAVITYKLGIHKLPPELPNDLRVTILRNQEMSEKCKKKKKR